MATDEEQKARRAALMEAARERIRKIVDDMPPLTDEQIDELRALLGLGGRPAAGPQCDEDHSTNSKTPLYIYLDIGTLAA